MKWFFFLSVFALHSYTQMHVLSPSEREMSEYTWEVLDGPPFRELLVSWNALRPSSGRYMFFVSVRQNGEWSPWLYYAEWSSPGQIMFKDIGSLATAHEGKIKVHSGEADGYRIQMSCSGGADLKQVFSLSSSILTAKSAPFSLETELPSILLENVPRQSQFSLRHPRYLDLSLPVATSILVNAFLGGKKVSASEFAERVIDDDTAFYEDWSLNLAEAAHALQGKAHLAIDSLPDFAALHALLKQGYPVVVPVSGWLEGSCRPFRTEHAVCIIGYDHPTQRVHVIDPAFPTDKATVTSFALADFLKAWSKHKNKALFLTGPNL